MTSRVAAVYGVLFARTDDSVIQLGCFNRLG